MTVPNGLLAGELYIWHAFHDGLEDFLGLSSRQPRAKTKMNSHSEGEVLVVLALDIEDVRISEVSGIAIGGIQHLKGDLPFQQILSA